MSLPISLYRGLFISVSVCPSVALVHPAEAIGRNGMPFGRDTHVVPSNSLRQGSRTPWEGEIWTLESESYCKLWPNGY